MQRILLMVALIGCSAEYDELTTPADASETTTDPQTESHALVSSCTWGLRDLAWRTVTVAVEVYGESSDRRCADELLIMGNEILTTVVPCDWDGIHRVNLRLPVRLYTQLEIRAEPPIDTWVTIGMASYVTITPDRTSFYRFVTIVD